MWELFFYSFLPRSLCSTSKCFFFTQINTFFAHSLSVNARHCLMQTCEKKYLTNATRGRKKIARKERAKKIPLKFNSDVEKKKQKSAHITRKKRDYISVDFSLHIIYLFCFWALCAPSPSSSLRVGVLKVVGAFSAFFFRSQFSVPSSFLWK